MLVHCMTGTSRSACAVIGYLMWKKKWSLSYSLHFVSSKRSSVSLQPVALDQLRRLESELFGTAWGPGNSWQASASGGVQNPFPPSFANLENRDGFVFGCDVHGDTMCTD